jgi:hypothetical protein
MRPPLDLPIEGVNKPRKTVAAKVWCLKRDMPVDDDDDSTAAVAAAAAAAAAADDVDGDGDM